MSDQLHPTKLLTPDWGDARILVDEDLVPMILLLWGRGFKTNASCQNLGDYLLRKAAWEQAAGEYGYAEHYRREADASVARVLLSMPVLDAVIFLNWMGKTENAAFNRRVLEPTGPGVWKKHVPLIPHEPNGGFAAEPTGTFRPDDTAQLRFPIHDIPIIEDNLRLMESQNLMRNNLV